MAMSDSTAPAHTNRPYVKQGAIALRFVETRLDTRHPRLQITTHEHDSRGRGESEVNVVYCVGMCYREIIQCFGRLNVGQILMKPIIDCQSPILMIFNTTRRLLLHTVAQAMKTMLWKEDHTGKNGVASTVYCASKSLFDRAHKCLCRNSDHMTPL
ncbi:hypothetical protein BDR04DRAFT_680478 [Suillus decipiens]|nr:hypothetical protein BDR04DRAFT_680478 [Suillus decipiens]